MMQFDLLSVVMLLGAGQGFFLALLLIAKRTMRTANRILATLMAAYSLVLGAVALEVANAYATFPHLMGTATTLPFLYGPLHFLYAKYLSSGQRSFKRIDALHLLPFVGYTLYLLPFYLESAAYKRAFFLSMQTGQVPMVLEVVAGLKGAHGLAYMILTLYLLRRYRQQNNTTALADEMLDLNWLWQITLITTGIWGLNAVLLSSGWAGYTLFGGTDIVIGVSVTIAIYALGYIGLRQSAVFSDRMAFKKTTQKYERSGLSPEQADRYVEKLMQAMEKDQMFRQSDLTMPELARELSMSPNHLSQVINEQLNKNFFELVNAYRIEEAKKRLLDPDAEPLTILAIAYEVGFNSKSAFNTAFKKYTGMTPTQFRKVPQRKKRS